MQGLAQSVDNTKASISATRAELGVLTEQLNIKWTPEKFAAAQEVAQRAVSQTTEQVDQLRERLALMEEAGVTDENRREFEDLRRQIIEAEEAARRAREELEDLNNIRFDQLEQKLNDVSDRLGELGDAVMPLSAAMAAGMAGATKAAIDFEDAMAGVAKTTDLTDQELSAMGNSIRQLSLEIPRSAEELAGITEAAGQLGIAKENLVDFTRTVADLDVATDMAGETAAMTLAQFANITQMDQSNFGRLGATIVDLGNNLATTESAIADMAQNLASAGSQANMTESDILAISATLSSLGLAAQAGGTSFSKVINEINVAAQTGSGRLSEFAQVAGMSASDFAAAWQEDATGALLAFVEGLGDVERSGSTAVVMLEELGITETRMRDALTRAAGAGGLFRESIELASTAWEENIALTNEAERKYATTASQMQLLKNTVVDIGIEFGGVFLPLVRNGIDAVGSFASWLKNLDDATQRNILRFMAFAAVLGPTLKVMGLMVGVGANVVRTFGMISSAVRLYQAAVAAGVRPVLVLSGKGAETSKEDIPEGTLIFADLAEAAEHILQS